MVCPFCASNAWRVPGRERGWALRGPAALLWGSAGCRHFFHSGDEVGVVLHISGLLITLYKTMNRTHTPDSWPILHTSSPYSSETPSTHAGASGASFLFIFREHIQCTYLLYCRCDFEVFKIAGLNQYFAKSASHVRFVDPIHSIISHLLILRLTAN